MSRIFVIMGKSASGKDTIFKRLEETAELNLKTVVIYTTRSMRVGETNGVEYFFTNKDELEQFKKQKKVIEHRSYNTIHGEWDYFTVNDGQIDLREKNYIVIGTLESYIQMKKYYGKDVIVPIYIEVNDGIRLERALSREKKQKEPKYAEMCRRFLADEQDFSKDKLDKEKIDIIYQNMNTDKCILEIVKDIKKLL